MKDEDDREAREQKWDSRSPLERLLSLTRQEQTAFLAFFCGGFRGNMQGAWRADTGKQIPISFGKAECEWPDFDLWRFKLPGLRLTTFEEGARRCALGMTAGSVVWPITIRVTEDGHEAREAYWAMTPADFAQTMTPQ
jgi:hypothetical protein